MSKPVFIPLSLLAVVVGLNAQKYDVHLTPPVRVGQVYAFSASGSSSQKAAAGDRVMQSSEYYVAFAGRAEILSVDKSERPFRLAFTVEKFTRTEGNATQVMLPPGSLVLVDGSAKVPVSLKDGVMPESSRAAFNVIYSVHHPSDVTDDDIFGTKTPKAVGDSWPMNSALASEDLKSTGLSIAADKLNGKVTLKGIDKVGGTDCLDLVGDMQANTFTPGNAPPGTTFDQMGITAVFRGCFPVNPAVPSHREGEDVSFQMRVHQKDGPTVDVSFSQKSDSTWIGSSE